ncbi:hypothetical protein UFOVP728_10 [uncultured Caudovirales phage]|uniref:Uncharacterized protein n=1 Tax=uncultured Caudovirales phage TaxID=2100421 RepID=A0A6J5NSV8_9CAUD|nr:hypothetical protein UFOVP728_10 [uncultured Caudovirales phage]
MVKVRERRRQEILAEVAELIHELGGPGYAERHLRVSPDTIERWLAGKTVPPWSAVLALRAALGRMPGMEGWRGWQFSERDGLLYAPGYTRGFGPGEMLAWHFKEQSLRHLERRVAELEAKLEAREAQLDALVPAANERMVR